MDIAGIIDHTLLKPDCTLSEIKKHCEEALRHKLFAVNIPPYYVRDAAYVLNERLKIVTVVGYPMGYSAIPAKVEEIKRAIDEGADEIDMVINHCAVKSGSWSAVRNEIDGTARAAAMKGKIFKTLIEPSLLTKEEMTKICAICTEVEVNFVSLGTGYHGKYGNADDIRLLRGALPAKIKIKTSGDFQSAAEVVLLLEAGADRIGTTNSIRLL
jgi:deoxyribose-phosphate aldolase